MNGFQVNRQSHTLSLKEKLDHAAQNEKSGLFADGEDVGVAKACHILLQPWPGARRDENNLATTYFRRSGDWLDLQGVSSDQLAVR